jgi:hypothetical protein
MPLPEGDKPATQFFRPKRAKNLRLRFFTLGAKCHMRPTKTQLKSRQFTQKSHTTRLD